MDAKVTVIIPTLCETSRKDGLLAAIDSIREQQDVQADILVVVNGKRFDPALMNELKARPDIQVKYQEEGSLPKALARGRSEVKTDYFCFLDDDDRLLPHSIALRLNTLEQNQNIDLAVTNGYNLYQQRQEIRVKHGNSINESPLMAMVKGNWLASCGGLFRTSTVSSTYFENLIKYYEWTLIGFRICLERKVAFIDQPTFVINDTPNSLSKSSEFVLSDEKVIELMLQYDIPNEIRKALKQKLTGTLHSISDHLRMSGQIKRAWHYHIKTLLSPGGFIYLPYTRRLLFPARR